MPSARVDGKKDAFHIPTASLGCQNPAFGQSCEITSQSIYPPRTGFPWHVCRSWSMFYRYSERFHHGPSDLSVKNESKVTGAWQDKKNGYDVSKAYELRAG
ncbi:hypothetical protein AVEN_182351-1 [Araneus ventricosus]|uniref:Uncharacterized protein n=1 Tax=Araneus ventricosus TaxID=182803 RepID=A0A4Y2TQC7_ARAVE|nr:hypothetical protein AVEN_182351-1 [Araneus ventricosus]